MQDYMERDLSEQNQRTLLREDHDLKIETRINTKEKEKPPRVLYAALALLDPVKFNNHEFWDLLFKNKLESSIKQIRSHINSAEFTEVSPFHFYYWPDVIIHYPKLDQFICWLESNLDIKICSKILECVAETCLDPASKFVITDSLEKYKLRLNQMASPGHELPILSTEPSNPPIQLLGEPQNEFNIRAIKHNINMQILSGFIAVMGVVAIAVAFTALNAASCGMPGIAVAGVGLATTLTGLGLFKQAYSNTTTAYEAASRIPLSTIPTI